MSKQLARLERAQAIIRSRCQKIAGAHAQPTSVSSNHKVLRWQSATRRPGRRCPCASGGGRQCMSRIARSEWAELSSAARHATWGFSAAVLTARPAGGGRHVIGDALGGESRASACAQTSARRRSSRRESESTQLNLAMMRETITAALEASAPSTASHQPPNQAGSDIISQGLLSGGGDLVWISLSGNLMSLGVRLG